LCGFSFEGVIPQLAQSRWLELRENSKPEKFGIDKTTGDGEGKSWKRGATESVYKHPSNIGFTSELYVGE